MHYPKNLLNDEGIKEWKSIEKSYNKSSLLLGNGFSLNFSQTLRYKSLYENFFSNCSEKARKLFKVLETENFENVLESIDIAEIVSETLDLKSDSFQHYREEVREGLINSINKIHPKPDFIDQEKITSISNQILEFEKIFTTNYDLFLYYIILETKVFGDFFFKTHDEQFNSFSSSDTLRDLHIHYLHGALFLFEKGLTTLKIKRQNEEWLLKSITEQIKNSNYPLFISEGKSEKKLKAIQANSYLTFCLDKFKKSRIKKIVIFGQSLGQQDRHIVNIIDENYEKVAISIRVEDWSTLGELRAEKNRLASLFKKAKYDFFDSKSLFDFN